MPINSVIANIFIRRVYKKCQVITNQYVLCAVDIKHYTMSLSLIITKAIQNNIAGCADWIVICKP